MKQVVTSVKNSFVEMCFSDQRLRRHYEEGKEIKKNERNNERRKAIFLRKNELHITEN